MKDERSAFPQMTYEPAGERPGHFTTGGMTLRDYFAGQSITGILASLPYQGLNDIEAAARRAYELADAMIVQREKE